MPDKLPAVRVKGIARRNHLGVSIWRAGRLVGGVCLLFHLSGPRPDLFPHFHLGLEWRGRLWSCFLTLGPRRRAG
jgi:hypothetical protein